MSTAIETKTTLYVEPLASDGWNAPQKVEARNIDAHAAELAKPRYMIGFRYYEQTSTVAGGETLSGPRRYDPGIYYFGERIATADIDSLQKLPDWQREIIKSNLLQAKLPSAILLRNGGVRECTDADTALTAFSEGIRAALSTPAAQPVAAGSPGGFSAADIRRICATEGGPVNDALQPSVQEGLNRMGRLEFSTEDVRRQLETARSAVASDHWDLSCRFDRESLGELQREVRGLEALLGFMTAHADDVARLAKATS